MLRLRKRSFSDLKIQLGQMAAVQMADEVGCTQDDLIDMLFHGCASQRRSEKRLNAVTLCIGTLASRP